MKYIIFSDVHSNLEALETFLALTDRQDDWRLICLGDVVGYGACPNECLDQLRERKIPILMGNHEKAIWDEEERESFNRYARTAVEWQINILTLSNQSFLRELPYTEDISDENGNAFSITHADFFDPPLFLYLTSLQSAGYSFTAMERDIGFFGHTHLPGVFIETLEETSNERFSYTVIRGTDYKLFLEENHRYLFNPGSIGQPRDFDNRASYLIFDSDEMSVMWRRVSYKVQIESDRIHRAQLPAFLAERIQIGQ